MAKLTFTATYNHKPSTFKFSDSPDKKIEVILTPIWKEDKFRYKAQEE